jgi:hypothetical protein
VAVFGSKNSNPALRRCRNKEKSAMVTIRTQVLILLLSGAAGFSSALPRQAPPDGPSYVNGTNLRRPADYREWPFLGAGLGLTYDDEAGSRRGAPPFTNVFVNPSSYRAFMQTGAWPNGSVFVLEFRRSESEKTPNRGGQFQGDLIGLEAEVKDSRFPDGWAFFNLSERGKPVDAAPPLTGDAAAPCVECHSKHTAVERTFVQFYPTLLEVARRRGTVKPGF